MIATAGIPFAPNDFATSVSASNSLRFAAVANQPAGRDFLSLAGPGFRDFTRIAASDPTVWRDILMSNREEILKQSQRFRHTLDAMEHVIKTGNAEALEDLIRKASEARSLLTPEADFAAAADRSITQPRWEGKTMGGVEYFVEHAEEVAPPFPGGRGAGPCSASAAARRASRA